LEGLSNSLKERILQEWSNGPSLASLLNGEESQGGLMMTAGEMMTSPVLATTSRASVRDIANELVKNEISGMPVADHAGNVLGVITEGDLLAVLAEGKKLDALTAEDIMSKEPVTVDVKAPMTKVMRILSEEGILRVPVTDGGKLVGIVSREDIIRAALEEEFLSFE
jgi:CBS domain-containing protein